MQEQETGGRSSIRRQEAGAGTGGRMQEQEQETRKEKRYGQSFCMETVL